MNEWVNCYACGLEMKIMSLSCKAGVVLVSYSGDSVDVVYEIDRSIIRFGEESRLFSIRRYCGCMDK